MSFELRRRLMGVGVETETYEFTPMFYTNQVTSYITDEEGIEIEQFDIPYYDVTDPNQSSINILEVFNKSKIKNKKSILLFDESNDTYSVSVKLNAGGIDYTAKIYYYENANGVPIMKEFTGSADIIATTGSVQRYAIISCDAERICYATKCICGALIGGLQIGIEISKQLYTAGDVNIEDSFRKTSFPNSVIKVPPCNTIKKYALQHTKASQVILPKDLLILQERIFDAYLNVGTHVIPESVNTLGNYYCGVKKLYLKTNAYANWMRRTNNDSYITRQVILGSKALRGNTGERCGYVLENDVLYYINEKDNTKQLLLGTDAVGGELDLTDVTSINSYAFYKLTNLTHVVLPDIITSIPDSLFEGVGITSIDIPNGVTVINNKAFYNCNKLASISFPDTIESIGENALNNTAWLNNQSGIIYPNKNILYKYKGSDANVEVREGTIQVASYAFQSNRYIENVVFPNSVTSTGRNMFQNCSNLKSVTIGTGISGIPIYFFLGCISLQTINYRGTEEQWNSLTKGQGWNSEVPSTCVINFNYVDQ